MIVAKTILVATDFGPESEIALRYGKELARAFGAALHVVHVTDNLFARSVDGFGYAGFPPQMQEEIEAEARKRTDALIEESERQELSATTVTVTDNGPAAAIVEYARKHAVDLIIVGTHGRGAVARVFLGSVAERVVRSAPCPGPDRAAPGTRLRPARCPGGGVEGVEQSARAVGLGIRAGEADGGAGTNAVSAGNPP